jgi:hypothetical protein
MRTTQSSWAADSISKPQVCDWQLIDMSNVEQTNHSLIPLGQ